MKLKLPDAYDVGRYLDSRVTLAITLFVFGILGLIAALSVEPQPEEPFIFFIVPGLAGAIIHITLFLRIQEREPRLQPPNDSLGKNRVQIKK